MPFVSFHRPTLTAALKALPGLLGKAGVCGCIGYTLQQNTAQLWICEGESMSPTLRDSDVVLASPYQTAGNCPAFPLSVLAHLFMRPSSLKRGDIVVVRDPWDPKTALCKRVIALPGDTVWMDDEEEVVGKGKVWIEGDNSEDSVDSREYGTVPIGLVEGIVTRKMRNPFARLATS